MPNVIIERSPDLKPVETEYEAALRYVDECLQFLSLKSIQNFEVICDSSNNTAATIANKELNVFISIEPDEWKYLALVNSDGVFEHGSWYARVGFNWFEIIDGVLSATVEFI